MSHEIGQKTAWDQCEYFSFISTPEKTEVQIKMCKTFTIWGRNWSVKATEIGNDVTTPTSRQRAIIFLLKAKWKQSTSKGVKALKKPTKLFLYKVYKPALQHFQMFPFIWLLPPHGAPAFPLTLVNKLSSTSQGIFFSCFNPWSKSLWWSCRGF